MLISNAGKKDKLINKYPSLESEIEQINEVGTKFLEWGIKQLNQGYSIEDIVSTLLLFERFQKALPGHLRDHNKFSDLDQMSNLLKEKEFKSKSKKERRARSNFDVLYQDEEILVGVPTTKEACIRYGKNTKWCITSTETGHYEEGILEHDIFYYIISKNKGSDDPLHKIAVVYSKDPKTNNTFLSEIKNALDEDIGWSDIPNSEKVKDVIHKDLESRPPLDVYYLYGGLLDTRGVLELFNSYDSKGLNVLFNYLHPKYLEEEEIAKRILEEDTGHKSRIAAADNIPESIMPLLINDPSVHLRVELARNPNISEEVLKELSKDEDPKVLKALAFRNDLPTDIIKQLIFRNESSVNEALASKENSSPEVLEILSDNEDPFIREMVLENPNVTLSIIEKLSNDSDENVKELAESMLKGKRGYLINSKILKIAKIFEYFTTE